MYFKMPFESALNNPQIVDRIVFRNIRKPCPGSSSLALLTMLATAIARLAAKTLCAKNTAIRSFRENGCWGGAVQIEYNG